MIINLDKLNDAKIKSTGAAPVKMGFSSRAHGMLFEMFTGQIYSNPIGSIVREITSNCFDSHIEAGKENPTNPVIVAHTYDKVTSEHFLSFIDNGMGMSPERVTNIYGQYFETTKADSNDQIGGFGIGGKSPMAYTDSFSVITRYNGIEYIYIIYKGSQSPEIQLLSEMSTTECNGTEIRIPIKTTDLDKFVSEIERQLYYFENIIYQGFDNDDELNAYNIYKGKNFLYRGKVYGEEIHLCIGKVAYPIKFNDMNLSRYDYKVPVALKFEIGDLDVTPNREEVRYTPKTIEKINEKIQLVKKELIEMIGKQYENIVTLEDYYNVKDNFGKLIFKNQAEINLSSWIKKDEINYSNFIYNALPKIPTTSEIIELFYNVQRYNKNRRQSSPTVKYGMNNVPDNVYHCTGEFVRKVLKQSYLTFVHEKNFTILKPYFYDFKKDGISLTLQQSFGTVKDTNANQWGMPHNYVDVIPQQEAIELISSFQKDVIDWVTSNTQSYEDLVVPEDFIIARKKQRLSVEIMKHTFIVGDVTHYNNKRNITVKSIAEFKGRIFYATSEYADLVKEGWKLYSNMFGDAHIDKVNYSNNKFKEGKGIAFITVAKTNEKYVKMCPNTYHIEMLYPLMLRRKMVNSHDIKLALNYISKWDNEFKYTIYANPEFCSLSQEVVNSAKAIKEEVALLEKYEKYEDINFNSKLITKYFKISIDKATLKINSEKDMDFLMTVKTINEPILKWVNLPYSPEDATLKTEFIEFLKKVMIL